MESIVIALMLAWLVIMLSGPLFLGAWIYIDARRRGSESSVLVAIGGACLLVPAVIYFFRRDRIGSRGPMGRGEQLVGMAVLGTLFGLLGGILSPPDPAAGGIYALMFVPVGLGVGYVLLWRRRWPKVRARFRE